MKKIIIFSLFLFTCLSVRAENLYVGLQFSFIDLKLESTNAKSRGDLEGYSIVTGYKINKNLAIEGFYGNEGRDDASFANADFDVKLKSIYGANVLGILPLADFLDLYAKTGITEINFKDTDKDKSSASGLLYGLGMSINVIKQFSIKLEYLGYPSGEYDNFNIDVDTKTFNFGFYLNL